MQLHRLPGPLPPEARGAVVAIGNFDGVHLGHRAVIAEAAALARARGQPLGVLTFEPHPREVVAPQSAPPRLTGFAQKAAILRTLGVEQLFVLRFCRQLMTLSAEAFVEEILHHTLGVAGVTVGEDFRFGRGRAGSPALLRTRLEPHGVEVAVLSKLAVDGVICSSSTIRRALLEGDPARATRLLGRPYELEGRVVHGDGLGRQLGVPTANLHIAGRRRLWPARGIYVVRAGVREAGGWRWHAAVASLGTRPAVGGGDLRLEVHILDAAPYLYGRRLRVAFLHWLREERDFPDLDALVAQIHRDIEAARAWHAGRLIPEPRRSM